MRWKRTIICWVVLIQCRSVTDERTDGRTDGRTDERTDGQNQYQMSVLLCWGAIKIGETYCHDYLQIHRRLRVYEMCITSVYLAEIKFTCCYCYCQSPDWLPCPRTAIIRCTLLTVSTLSHFVAHGVWQLRRKLSATSCCVPRENRFQSI